MTLRLGLGPVFAYEWLRATRRSLMYAWRAGFVLVLLGGPGAGLAGRVEPHRPRYHPGTGRAREIVLRDHRVRGGGHRSTRRAGGHGRRDLPGAGRGTLLDVLGTDLSSAEVVLGKLAARLLPVLATIAAALPVLAITSLFGGIDPGALGGSFAVGSDRGPLRRAGAGRLARERS